MRIVDIINPYHLHLAEWLLVFFCGFFLGISKTGITGAGLVVVPTMAAIFGGRVSTGILLPMLIMTDIFALLYYHRYADWHYIGKLLPWVFAGIVVAMFIGKYISDTAFKQLLATLVLAGLFLLVWQDIKKKVMEVPDTRFFAASTGFAGGFSSMIANASNPVMAIYLLAMRLPKNVFIGTAAWFFGIMNFSKLPVHIFYWKTISLQSILFNLTALPSIIVGVLSGIYIVKKIPEHIYRIVVIVTTLLSSCVMIFRT